MSYTHGWVRRYAELGWESVPLDARDSKQEGKAPRWSFKDATLEAQEPDTDSLNLGVRLPQGMIVVDLDPQNQADMSIEQRLPKTMSASTPKGGRHLVYQYDAPLPRGVQGVDFITRDTKIFAAQPSVNFVNGRAYRWDNPQVLGKVSALTYDQLAGALHNYNPDDLLSSLATEHEGKYREGMRIVEEKIELGPGEQWDGLSAAACYIVIKYGPDARETYDAVVARFATPAKSQRDVEYQWNSTVQNLGHLYEEREEQEVTEEKHSSWFPVDLDEILAGDYKPLEATWGLREDGNALFYQGRTHSLYGEPESGKTWVAKYLVAEALQKGERALYLDWENNPEETVAHLRMLGVPVGVLHDFFDYVRPEQKWNDDAVRDDFQALLHTHYAVVILDGITVAMTQNGLVGRDESEVAAFYRLPDQFAKGGACVVMIDHVTKSGESGNRFAIGSQHKLGGLSGAGYSVAMTDNFAAGKIGRAVLSVTKDRPGGVRRWADGPKKGAVQQVAAFVMDESEPGNLCTRLAVVSQEDVLPKAFFRAVWEVVDEKAPVTQRKVRDAMKRSAADVSRAMDYLAEHDYIAGEDVVVQGNHTVAYRVQAVYDPDTDPNLV